MEREIVFRTVWILSKSDFFGAAQELEAVGPQWLDRGFIIEQFYCLILGVFISRLRF